MDKPLKPVQFLGSDIPLPFGFTARLPFSAEDKQDMPWLKNPIRYYGIETELGKGGRAIAYKGFVSDELGNRLNKSDIVLKVPNLNIDLFDAGQIEEYLIRQAKEGGREWQLTRQRLRGCPYANPIFDFDAGTQVTYLDELFALPITAQMFLHDALSLDDYLLKIHQRTEPYKSKRGVPVDNWNGMSDPARWIELARGIATGLADIHERRVVHGDIWPPNIFIRVDEDNKPFPIFIDFGEAFPIEPKGDPRKQRDHAYRAPERSDAQSIVTEQADVYSFGKLLLHLAIGEEPRVPSELRGHKRRAFITGKFSRNPIARENPFIIDIICKCVSLDPVDRLSMSDVLDALNSYVDLKSYPTSRPSVSVRLAALGESWNRITAEMPAGNPFLEELVQQKIDGIDKVMKGLSKDVITLTDTREKLITALIGLFRRLDEGDRFLSLTHPRMWQGTSLGLDGRYFTATELATDRGASIQRAFIFSVQEVGDGWAAALADNLEELNKNAPNVRAINLANALRIKIDRYKAAHQKREVQNLLPDLQVDARQRLTLVIKSYLDASQGVLCKDKFDESEKFTSSKDCKGLYIGLIPVSTLSSMRTLKSAHPMSVLFYGAAEARDQYLLIMTDCLGRTSYGGGEENTSDDIAFQKSKPELRGIKVFKSALGVPQDRIRKLEQIFGQSINIGGWIDNLHAALPPWDALI